MANRLVGAWPEYFYACWEAFLVANRLVGAYPSTSMPTGRPFWWQTG